MHNIKDIRNNIESFKKSMEKRYIELDIKTKNKLMNNAHEKNMSLEEYLKLFINKL